MLNKGKFCWCGYLDCFHLLWLFSFFTIMHLQPKQRDKAGDISMAVLRNSLQSHTAVPKLIAPGGTGGLQRLNSQLIFS